MIMVKHKRLAKIRRKCQQTDNDEYFQQKKKRFLVYLTDKK